MDHFGMFRVLLQIAGEERAGGANNEAAGLGVGDHLPG